MYAWQQRRDEQYQEWTICTSICLQHTTVYISIETQPGRALPGPTWAIPLASLLEASAIVEGWAAGTVWVPPRRFDVHRCILVESQLCRLAGWLAGYLFMLAVKDASIC